MRSSFFSPELLAYLTEQGMAELPVMPELRRRTAALGEVARMQIDAHQGQVMTFLMQLIDAKKIIEIGTFTGMSSLWLARALSDGGELHCCDINGEWTDIARFAWKESGLEHKIQLHLAPALETLPKFADGEFDAIFIDADKGNYPNYIEQSCRLLRRGGLIMIDNTLWGGEVLNANSSDKVVKTIQSVNNKIHADARFQSVILPIGDGLTLAMKI
ncbi:MAG TPA: O-methyltransferase [Alphaproteobacteria bacterium]|nr:O-methyltransferase [Alphaproteobacteria bacterium]